MLRTLFAYSKEMKFIVFIFASIYGFIHAWFSTKLVLIIYNESVKTCRRVIFSFITGVVLYVWLFYLFYILEGYKILPLTRMLIDFPNPISTLIWWILSIKILKLSPYRSISLMRNFYLYQVIVMSSLKLMNNIFFTQSIKPTNYMIESLKVFGQILLVLIVYKITKFLIERTQFLIRLPDGMHMKSISLELIKYVFQTSIIYFLCIFYSFQSNSGNYMYVYTIIALILLMLVSLLNDYRKVTKIELENKAKFISALSSSIDQFNEIRHDFNNILQTYGGYISLGDISAIQRYHNNTVGIFVHSGNQMDMAKKLEQNPPLVSLFLQKLKLAESKNIIMKHLLLCRLDDFSLDVILLCRVIGNLIDNAIEAASVTNNKIVNVTIEQKKNTKLIVVSNSVNENVDINKILAKGYTDKKGHLGLGLSNVRKILGEYPGCSIHITCDYNEFIVYVEIPKK